MSRTIIHYTEAPVFGGAERMLLTLMAGLDRDRWRSVLFVHDAPGITQLLDEARSLGIPTRSFPRISGKRGIAAIPRFLAAMRRERPAVFHAHPGWALRCARGLVLARLSGIAAVVATQQLFALPPKASDRRKHELVSRFVHRYIAVSEATAEEMSAVVADPGKRIQVVRNGASLGEFLRIEKQVSAPSTQPTILTLARLEWQKGLEQLIRAAAEVPGATFIIAGEGKERSSLESLAGELQVTDRVRFAGHRTDVADLLGAADVFVLPSVMEGLPVSIVEAMASGTPVIATDIAGTREIVRHDVTGLLVPVGDHAALAAAIRRMLGDGQLRERLAATARALVTRDYSAEVMVSRVSAIYDDILSRTAS